ncbi:endo-beta-N-acetylglucosaminidase [Halalkalibacterium halodurans]|uniref:endo-beta-N-acetylglucosaminidase n=1 Tax=Halalkalibacterium halodurans TaxID=86665 RepID=UPI0006A9FC66|nr:discoidin domain-containing protein [Halalkalibacterium halodurans]TPE70250.1 PKD domain-containing protein [Halalkalibacterium halodurans]
MKKGSVFSFVFIAVLILVLLPSQGFASQPESSYWYPETLLDWSPETDPDARFNRSSIPLREREVLYTVNDTQQTDAKLVALSALNPNTSGVPSQGGNEFFANTFGFWQYVDLMVYWAGSAGEGIITPPSGDVIDAAHRNGVPILGNVFFPPKVYGGQEEWVDKMLARGEDGSFPAADKLLEVAEYYGFDGWFINQETEGGTPETAKDMQEFLLYLQENKPEGMHIMWYDSMISNGDIRWQNYLTDENAMFFQAGNRKVADSMFLNFWWWNHSQERSKQKAASLGRSPYDLYAGIDVEANGTNTYVNWQQVFPEGGEPHTSLGIYRPDWAFKSSDTMRDFYDREQLFWVGPSRNPAKVDEHAEWKGMATYFPEKTVINELPFVTHFNTGSGQFFAINGKTKSDASWNNRSLQDLLPTWRWMAESGGTPLTVDFDWGESFYGGSSLKLSGDLSKENATNVKLYKTNLLIEKDTEIQLTYKTPVKKHGLKVGISFLDDPDEFIFFDLKKQGDHEWVTEKVKLKKHKGKQIAAISLYVESDQRITDYHLYVGELKISNKHDNQQVPPEVTKVKVSNHSFEDGIYADLSLEWTGGENVRHYEVYRQLASGEKQFLGATPNNVYYLSKLKRVGKEEATTLEVVPVSETFASRPSGTRVTFEWPPYPKPRADFSVSQTVAAPGESIQFFNHSSEVTESVEWTFEGGQPNRSDELNPVIVYQEEGTYSVKLVAKNSEGEDVLIRENFVTITEEAARMTNLALQKKATASGQCASSEGPDKAVDGNVSDNSKWCAIGTNQWLQVDLGEVYTIAKFVLKHAEAGGEPAAFNTKAYTIETSINGESWKPVVEVVNNTKATSEHSIPLESARYVRLLIDQPTQGGDQAARIYEFEAHGF